MTDAIIIPEHLRHTFYALVCYNRKSIQNGVATVTGAKVPLELNIADIEELAALGLYRLRPHSTKPEITMISSVDEILIYHSFNATFQDNPLPQHPAFWNVGDWSVGTIVAYEYLDGAVEGENHRIVEGEDGEPTRTIKSTFMDVECLMSAYSEKLYLYPAEKKDRLWPRYRTGMRDYDAYADGSFMATLHCIMDHEVYSAGHLFVKRIDGKKGYDLCLDSYALRAMLRWGLVEVARPYNIETRAPELYAVTDLGKEFYAKALPHLDKMGNQKRYNEIAEKMGWEII